MIVSDILGVQGPTTSVTATASAAALAAAIIVNAVGAKAKAVHIVAITNNLLVGFGPSGAVIIPVAAGTSLRITGQKNVAALRYKNATGDNAVFAATAEF